MLRLLLKIACIATFNSQGCLFGPPCGFLLPFLFLTKHCLHLALDGVIEAHCYVVDIGRTEVDSGWGKLWKPSRSGKPPRTWTWTVASSYPWSGTPSFPTNHHPPHHLAPFCLVNACSFLPLLPLILCLFGKHCMPLQFTLVNQSPVTYLSQSQTHTQSRSTIGQCLLYSLSHTAVSLVLYDKALHGRNVLHQLLFSSPDILHFLDRKYTYCML